VALEGAPGGGACFLVHVPVAGAATPATESAGAR
jgi:hypothetical protein